jgi:hypothetical protein
MTNAVVFDPSLGAAYTWPLSVPSWEMSRSPIRCSPKARDCARRDAYDSQPAATHWT